MSPDQDGPADQRTMARDDSVPGEPPTTAESPPAKGRRPGRRAGTRKRPVPDVEGAAADAAVPTPTVVDELDTAPPAGAPDGPATETADGPAAEPIALAPGPAPDPDDAGAETAQPEIAGPDRTSAERAMGGTTETAGAATGSETAAAVVEAGEGGPAKASDQDEHWTHFAPKPARVPGRAERIARRVGRFWIHEWTLAALGAIVLAVIMTWPSARHPATTIPADIWDPTLQAWQMAWAGHILKTDPTQLWNANAFYPDPYSYAYSDSLFGYFPAGLIGTGPVAALVRYNMIFIALHALAFFGAYVLTRQLGVRPIAAAVAGAAFAYAPWRWGQAGHMHVLSVGGIALSLAMLARGHGYSLRGVPPPQRRRRPGWAVAGWCVAAWQISLGFGIGLPFGYVLGGVVVIGLITWLVRGRPAVHRRLLLADGIGLVIFGAVSVFMARPYFEVLHRFPYVKRSMDELKIFSPNLRAFVTAPAQSLPWGSAHEAARATMIAPAETTLLPGFFLYGLALTGLFFSVWTVRTRLLLFAGLVLSVVLAMGTQFFDGHYTYVLLYKYLPGWNSIRTPGRLIIWTTLILAILAAGAVGALGRRSTALVAERVPSRPNLATRLAMLLPLLLVLAEGTNWGALEHPVVPTQPAAMRTVAGPLLVLPSDQLTDENVMIWSTTTFPKMVNGGSGFTPQDQANTREVAKGFPDQASVSYLRQLGVQHVIVVKDRATGGDYAKAASMDTPIDGLGITREDDGDTIVYTLGQ